MPFMTIAQAAKWAGVHRNTIQRAILNGRLSVAVNGLGRRVIDPSELSRVFEVKYSAPDPLAPADEPAPILTPDIENARVRDLHASIDDLRATVVDLRTRLDRAEQERNAMLRLLEDKTRSPWASFKRIFFK